MNMIKCKNCGKLCHPYEIYECVYCLEEVCALCCEENEDGDPAHADCNTY